LIVNGCELPTQKPETNNSNHVQLDKNVDKLNKKSTGPKSKNSKDTLIMFKN
jgi:hypothetical protein